MTAAWELAENEHDRAREAARAARHLNTMRQRREARFWPIVATAAIAGAYILAAAIEGGAL